LYEAGEHVQEIEKQKTRYEIKSIGTDGTDNQIPEDPVAKDGAHSRLEVFSELLIFRSQCRKSRLNTFDGQPC